MTDNRISTPFGAASTAAEVVAGVDLSGQRAIVTGGSSGLGLETARALAAAGAEVTLAVRNVSAGARAADDIIAGIGNGHVLVAPLDLADQASVTAFVDSWRGPLHILVNNAGVMAIPDLQRTPQSWELQFATNHLGHFALAVGLHEALATAGRARVVSVSSVGHIGGAVDFDDIHFQRRPYDQWVAYGQSKTANILFAVEANKRWAADGITSNALNPGRIPSTNLMRHLGEAGNATPGTATPARATPADASPGTAASANATPGKATATLTSNSTGVSWKNEEQGAATSVLLASSPLLEGIGGRYFEDCNEAGPHQPGIRRGVADYAIDPDNAARLWTVSLQDVRP